MSSAPPSRRSPSLPYDSIEDTEDCPSATPDQIHELNHDSSVLALAVSEDYIFAGTHNGEIAVWSLGTFELVHTIQAHKRTVLCLFLSTCGETPLLFSSAGDAVISVWDPKTFKRLYEIYSTFDVGDMFSVAYSAQHETVYMGAQNASIQWVNLKDPKRRVMQDSEKHPDRRYHRFFDSKAVGGTSTPRRNDDRWGRIPRSQAVLEVQTGAIRQFAHFGYVYSMLVAKGPTVLVDPEEEVLISGGGDGTIKLWKLSSDSHEDEDGATTDGDIQEIMVLGDDDAESVLSLAIDGSFLYAGKLHGAIELWDMDTKQKLRVIKAHVGDIMTLQMSWGLLWSAAAGGSACVSFGFCAGFCRVLFDLQDL
jgi:di- and tripeptidase